MKTNAIVFVRVSTLEQDYSRQVNELTKVCKSKNWTHVTTIKEKVSGASKNEDRQGITELQNLIKYGTIHKVLISEISRLGRDTLQTLQVLDELHKAGVSVYVQDLNIETLDDKGKVNFQAEMMLHMLSLFAKRERETTIERIRSGMAHAKSQGIHVGRSQGTSETTEEFLRKHKSIVDTLETGLSMRKTAKLHDVSVTTVQKVKKKLNLMQHLDAA